MTSIRTWMSVLLVMGIIGEGSVRAAQESAPGISESVEAGKSLVLLEPGHGAAVPEWPYVRGRVQNSKVHVWVIVHPMETGDYWVEPQAGVRDDGTWVAQAHIGRPGTIDVGKRFEVRAVANPASALHEGDVLPFWPDAQWSSDLIEVERR